MVKRIKKITEDKMKELQGFEEVMDLVVDEIEQVESKKSRRDNEKLTESYKISAFLESELNRHKKLDLLYAVKLPSKIKSDNTEALIENLEKSRIQLKHKLVHKYIENDSALNKNIELLFKRAFGG